MRRRITLEHDFMSIFTISTHQIQTLSGVDTYFLSQYFECLRWLNPGHIRKVPPSTVPVPTIALQFCSPEASVFCGVPQRPEE
jgi:hypothetical protein